MIKLKLYNDNRLVYSTDGLMLDIWKYKTLNDAGTMTAEVELVGDLYETEKEWLGKVLEWVYLNGNGVVSVNGNDYDVSEFQ